MGYKFVGNLFDRLAYPVMFHPFWFSGVKMLQYHINNTYVYIITYVDAGDWYGVIGASKLTFYSVWQNCVVQILQMLEKTLII